MMTNEQTTKLDQALSCSVEHLEGEHEGKVVIDHAVFEELYHGALVLKNLKEHQQALDALEVAREGLTEANYFGFGVYTEEQEAIILKAIEQINQILGGE